MVAVHIGHTITMVVLKRLNLLIFRLILNVLSHTIVLSSQHIGILFLCNNRGKNGMDDVVEAMDIHLKLFNGVLLLPDLVPILRLYVVKQGRYLAAINKVLTLAVSLDSAR
jgi:hypothetical protein